MPVQHSELRAQDGLEGGGIALDVPPAHGDPSTEVSSDDEEDEPAQPSASASASAATPAARPDSFGCTMDLSHRVPEGCRLRRYESEAERKRVGLLPTGRTDPMGVKSRSRVYHEGLRSAEDALAEVEVWLFM